MSEWYKLDKDNTPVGCSLEDFSGVFDLTDKRRVAKDVSGDVVVSTVFLGLNHNYGADPPILFETMIFGGEHDEDQWRYETWNQAIEGHKHACSVAGIDSNSE